MCNGFLNTKIDPNGGIHLINIEWQRNGQKINDTYDKYYTFTNIYLTKLQFGQLLIINSVKTSLAGIYSCVAWIGNNKTRSVTNSTTMTVPSKLSYFRFTYLITYNTVSMDITVISHYNSENDVTLKCDIKLNDNVDINTTALFEWKKGDISLKYYTTHITPTNSSSSTIFEIKNLKLSDAATYTCHVNVSSNSPYVLSIKTSKSIDVRVIGKLL